ncbi:MAG: agmatine deiminase, partial [Parasporobacterium sp.]|nr:agmatine deiminase [Parasporobacterium sp.]
MCKVLRSTPTEDGYRMPGESEPHAGCLMIWPERPGSWKKDPSAARKAFKEVAMAIAESETVYMLAGAAVLEDAVRTFEGCSNIKTIPFETDDAWARDTGATFVIKHDPAGGSKSRRGINWQFNAWGGSYDGLYADWDRDQKVAAGICETLGDDMYDAMHFVLEGGSIHVDGEGTLITTEECLLSPGRNPYMDRDEIEDNLMKYLGVRKIIWLPEGIYNDETNGHVDNFCCFTKPGEVLLAWTDDKNDPQYERSLKALNILEHETDASGRNFKITLLPIPKTPVCITGKDLEGYEFEEGEDTREIGERLAASYVNFYISNGAVVVP